MEDKNAYYLMHKNKILLELNLSRDGDIAIGRKNIDNIDFLPLGGKLNDSKLSLWWKSRYIPDNRDGIKKALKVAGYSSTGNALIDNLALSLNDCYWINRKDSNLTWEEVNLFNNNFIDTIGDAHFQSKIKPFAKSNKRNVGSTSGELKKKWCVDENNTRYLLKGNISKSYQQSLNEVFIYNIHKQLQSKYLLKYEVCEINVDDNKKIIGCKSTNFCNENVEFVSANEIIDMYKFKGSDNPFSLFKKGCLELGMKEDDFHNYMDYLILTDFIFTNTDRHLNNIGILRDSNTLKLIGFSPIFDSGNSMFFDKTYDELNHINLNKIKINSFFNSEKKMLSYVKNMNIINLDKIKPDFSIYQKDIKEEQIRYPLIESLFYKKVAMLKKYQKH